MEWGWRVPFILSAALVLIGLYVRVSLHETPVFAKVAKAGKQVKVPLGTLLSKHLKATILGTFIMLATYTLFYLMTVYSMTYGTTPQPLGLGYSQQLPVDVDGGGDRFRRDGTDRRPAGGRVRPPQDHDRHYPADDRIRVPVPDPAGFRQPRRW